MAESDLTEKSQIPESLKDLFIRALSAREEDLAKLNSWAKTYVRQILAGEIDYQTIADDYGVSTETTYRAMNLIAQLLYCLGSA